MDFGTVPVDTCGTVNYTFYALYDNGTRRSWQDQEQIPLSYNDEWRDGQNVAIMGT